MQQKNDHVPAILPFDLLEKTVNQALDSYLKELNTSSLWVKTLHYRVATNNIPAIAQKIFIPSHSEVALIGDLHGSLSSLLRTLLRLVLMGYINNDFTFKQDNFYMIFTGDLVDRGWYGVETFYTILLLKLANWDKVFILQGNHEASRINQITGFETEFKRKYPNEKNVIQQLYGFLPMVLYLCSGATEASAACAQCCHGGINRYFNPDDLIKASGPNRFAQINNSREKNRQDMHDFNWGDFKMDRDTGCIQCTSRCTPRGTVISDVAAYLKEHNISAIFRGHQDMLFGLKMFPTLEQINKLSEQNTEYGTATWAPDIILSMEVGQGMALVQDCAEACSHLIDSCEDQNCQHQTTIQQYYLRKLQGVLDDYLKISLWYWRDVISEDDQTNPHGFKVSSYAPIYTSSTALESQWSFFDAFSLLRTADDFKEWTLKHYETNLLDACSQVAWYKTHDDDTDIYKIEFSDDLACSLVKNFTSVAKENDHELTVTYSANATGSPISQEIVDVLLGKTTTESSANSSSSSSSRATTKK